MEGNCCAPDFPFFLKHKSGMVDERGVEKYKDVGWAYCPLLPAVSSWNNHSENAVGFAQQCLRIITQVWRRDSDIEDNGATISSSNRRHLHKRHMFLSLANWYYLYVCIYIFLYPGAVESYGPISGHRFAEGGFNNAIRKKYKWCYHPIVPHGTALLVTQQGNWYSSKASRRFICIMD